MYSSYWKEWSPEKDARTCKVCGRLGGKIYSADEPVHPSPPIHPNCRCVIETLKAIEAGKATIDGPDGADWHLKNNGRLPDYYVPYYVADNSGWKPKKANFAEVFPNKMLFGGIYKNKNGHLPEAPGRIWYEADINYRGGYRRTDRILYSNDGLIFVTYDHYHTFCEIK